MIYGPGTPLPAHVLAVVPDNFPGTLYGLWWQRGGIVVGICAANFDNLDIVTPLFGISIDANEARAVELAVHSFLVGWAQHRLAWDYELSDEEIVDALAAAEMRGDMDIADLLEAARERGIGPVSPAPSPTVGGLRPAALELPKRRG